MTYDRDEGLDPRVVAAQRDLAERIERFTGDVTRDLTALQADFQRLKQYAARIEEQREYWQRRCIEAEAHFKPGNGGVQAAPPASVAETLAFLSEVSR